MVAKVKELAMDGRYGFNRIMRSAVVIVADNVVFVCAVFTVAKVCVSKIGDIDFGAMNSS